MQNNFITKLKERGILVIAVRIAIPLLIGILSFTSISKIASSPQFHANAIQVLDQKKITVMGLSAGAASVAVSSSLLLGERALPVANKLMDLTGYFIIILLSIILEKYLLTILGVASFKIIIPIASLIYIISVFIKNDGLKKISIKFAIFAVVIFLVVPSSVGIANLIEKTYTDDINIILENSAKIEKDAFTINKQLEDVQKNKKNDEEYIYEENNIANNEDDDKNFFSQVKDIFNNARDAAGNVVGKAKDALSSGIKAITDKTKELFDISTKTLGNLIESIAILLVTTCVLPVLVLLFFIWIIKLFFNLDIKIGKNIKIGKK